MVSTTQRVIPRHKMEQLRTAANDSDFFRFNDDRGWRWSAFKEELE